MALAFGMRGAYAIPLPPQYWHRGACITERKLKVNKNHQDVITHVKILSMLQLILCFL